MQVAPTVAHQPLSEERKPLLRKLGGLSFLTASSWKTKHRLDNRRPRPTVRRRHDVLLDAHVQITVESGMSLPSRGS